MVMELEMGCDKNSPDTHNTHYMGNRMGMGSMWVDGNSYHNSNNQYNKGQKMTTDYGRPEPLGDQIAKEILKNQKEGISKLQIEEMYLKVKLGIWTVAYENNSDEVYKEVLGDLDELMKLIK